MTCSLNTIAIIDDLPHIRANLLPHLPDYMSDNDYPTTETDEEDAQSSTVDRQEVSLNLSSFVASETVARTAALLNTYGKKEKKSSNERYQWLRECQVSFSPTLNLLVTAFDQKIVVSAGK